MPSNEDHKIIIIGTSSETSVLQDLGLWDLFNMKIEIPELEHKHGEVNGVMGRVLPNLSQRKLSVALPDDFCIPMKHLIFLLNSLKFKLKNQGHDNLDENTLNDMFFNLYKQTI